MPKKTDSIRPIRTKVYDPIFKQEVTVFCNCTEAELSAWEKRLGVHEDDRRGLNPNFGAFSTHYSCNDAPNVYLIWLNRFDWTLDDQDTLIHEVVHTVTRIWEANNIKFVPETQEFFAHSVGRLYAAIAAKILLRKDKNGSKKARNAVSTKK